MGDMATAKVTSKGQITIPLDVRTALGLKAGSRVEFVAQSDGSYEILPATRSIKDLKGVVHTRRTITCGTLSSSSVRPGFVSTVVLCELFWVLASAYRIPPQEILVIIERMLGTRELHIQQSELVHRAVRASRGSSIEFVDALIGELGISAGCTETVTFDKRAAELPTMRLLTPS